MIFRSIKWSLQLWYGMILVFVLAGFGYTAFELQQTRELRRVDQQLQDRLAIIFSPRQQRPGADGSRRANPPPDQGDESAGPRRRDDTRDEAGASTGRGPFRTRLEERFREPRLPAELPPGFGQHAWAEDSVIYHVVWRREQRFSSLNAPPELTRPGSEEPPGPRTRGTYREYIRFTPRGDVIVVGRSIAPELAELRNLSLLLLGTGAAVLGLGLVGGWLVATRAMRPIESITTTALKISSGDLAQRIPQEESQSELGRLVSVLNSTFTRLESAFAEQTRFTTDVSHELRTPVSVIVSQTQMALTRERSPAEYQETLHACQRAAQRMRSLIESLMQLARLDAGQEKFRRDPVDLASITLETIELMQPIAQERGLTLHHQLAAAPLRGDAERLGQVVMNLLTNAIHYTPQGGSIRLETTTENDFATLRVADSGIGIPTQDLPHIFNRFYRVEKSRTREKGGSGLGLAISKAIIAAHSGSIIVSSQVGQGTTFTLRIPSEK